MGYAATIIVLYGVVLDSTQSKELQKVLLPEEYQDGELRLVPTDRLTLVDPMPEHLGSRDAQYVDGIQRSFGRTPRTIHDAQCCSHDTDSRVDNLSFDDGNTHTVGIYCGSRGYAYGDKIEDIISNIPERAKENFRDFVAPILARIGVTDAPKISLVNQVW